MADYYIQIYDPNCDPWRDEMVTYTVSIPQKKDGILSPQYAVWHKGDNPNDKVHNWYYSDAGSGGGYNDLEMLRYKRTYDEGPNKVGDLEAPMHETQLWLNQNVLGN